MSQDVKLQDLARPSAVLVGRDRELAACAHLLTRSGHDTGVLVLRGPAGIGKTAVLDAARVQAARLGFRVLSGAGSEAERTFAFAALQPLLLPVIDADTGLPEHLRKSLRSAVGLIDAEIPALETVGLAVLGLLTGLASDSAPLCLVIDDLHWLDDSSAAVLRFVARRLASDPVVILAAAREGGWPSGREIPDVPVGPLDPAAAEALLTSSQPALPPAVRQQVLAQALGNPLALVELSGAVAAAEPAPGNLPLTERLMEAFAGRTLTLPAETRTVLLVAALAPTAVIAEVLASATALARTPIPLDTLDPAVSERLIDVVDRRIRFRHPLMSSGVIQASSPSSRRAAHLALAGVIQDAGRRLHHRAEASVGYDEELAGDLEAAARQTMRHGSGASAVTLLDQAAALTPPGPARGSRLVQAAHLSFDLGRAGEVRRLLTLAGVNELSGTDRRRARRLELEIDSVDTDDPAPVRELVALAEEAIIAGDHDDALGLLQIASARVVWNRSWAEVCEEVVATARKVPGAENDPRILAILAQTTPIAASHELAARLNALDDCQLTDPVAQHIAGVAAVDIGEYERGATFLARAEQQLRKEARLALLTRVLFFHGVAAFGGGRWQIAEQMLNEAERLTGDTAWEAGRLGARYVRAGLAGLRGDERLHRQIIDELTTLYQRRNVTHRDNHLTYMRGIAATMLGRHDDAVILLSALFEPDHPMFEARTCSDSLFFLADSAAAGNRADVVEQAIDTVLTTVPEPLPAAFQASIDYARAVTAADAQARRLFDVALTGPGGRRAFDRARTQLAYGRWLRHRHQHLQARELLRTARVTFDHLGNVPFGDRARAELRAAGEAIPGTDGIDWEQLSPQELQIAQLVAEGLSNRQIGERLFLSHRTIASHLYNMFPKLNVSSRTQLAAVIRQR